jgi:hypothetical protein
MWTPKSPAETEDDEIRDILSIFVAWHLSIEKLTSEPKGQLIEKRGGEKNANRISSRHDNNMNKIFSYSVPYTFLFKSDSVRVLFIG